MPGSMQVAVAQWVSLSADSEQSIYNRQPLTFLRAPALRDCERSGRGRPNAVEITINSSIGQLLLPIHALLVFVR